MKKRYFILLFVLFIASFVFADQEAKPLKIYIDYLPCDFDFIKTNITYVDYVTSSEVSDVHVIFYKNRLASSGIKYTVEFTGKNSYEELLESLEFNVFSDDSENEIREKTRQILELGFAYFIAHSSSYKNISINYKTLENKNDKKTEAKEGWIFGINLNGNMNGSSGKFFFNSWNNINIKKVTEKRRIECSLGLNYNESRYEIDNDISKYINKSYYLDITNIFAINNHFSWAFFVYGQQSTFSNIRYKLSVSPALEYNYFPYDQSASKQLRFRVQVTPAYYNYFEETIYHKNSEFLWKNRISISYEFIRKWGSNETSINASHYVHNTSLNNFSLSNDTSINLFKGFNLNFSMYASRTHDQVYISGAGASDEDIYLNIKAIQSSYSYWTMLGISYTFGSIYSNVVNPRFGY